MYSENLLASQAKILGGLLRGILKKYKKSASEVKVREVAEKADSLAAKM